MVVHDLDIFRAGVRPVETHPKLVVYSNTVLPGTAALERLQPVTRRDTKVFKPARDLQLTKLASRRRFDIRKSPDTLPIREGFRVGTSERYYHTQP